MLPELCLNAEAEPNALTKEFSSADRVLDFDGTVMLLKKHRLMVEDVNHENGELLR
jgi:hypothetical protein